MFTVSDDVDTFKCPKCGAMWRARGEYDYDKLGWHYPDDEDAEYCPRGCRTRFGFRVKGKIQEHS